MKRIILFLILISFSMILFGQVITFAAQTTQTLNSSSTNYTRFNINISENAKDRGFARVQKLDGIEVYILSEPLREYETVTSVTTGVKAESILTGGLINESISDKVLQFIRRARKQGATFDAVLYSGGKEITTIKFTKDATSNNRGIGRVRKLDNTDVYVLAEPIQDYETIISKGGGIKYKSILTGGIVNNSIEDDLSGFIKSMRSSGANMDGIIYSGGKSAMSIRYK